MGKFIEDYSHSKCFVAIELQLTANSITLRDAQYIGYHFGID